MKRLPALVLGALVAATVAAFFVTQHLKVTTPLLSGDPFPVPDPAVINPVSGGTCDGKQHRVTHVSFYLLHRSDNVDVYVVDQSLNVVATVASNRHMRRGVRNPDGEFSWDGREDNGRVAPDGIYYFEVALIHQGRTVVISNAAGPEPITVQTTPPRPVVTSVTPRLIPAAGSTSVRIRYTGNEQLGGYVNLYRTDLPGAPRVVKTFGLPWAGHVAVWDGTIDQRAAPPGVYLVGLTIRDASCTTGRFPTRLPPRPGSTPHAGVTVRYLAAEPTLESTPAGSRASVLVDSREAPYRWSLHTPGTPKPIASGQADQPTLSVPLPRRRAGLYELALRAGTHTTAVPLVASAPVREPVLVVLPALTWQGLNPVDDAGDGVPNTLTDGGPIELERPLADGLPAGFADEAGFLAYLDRSHDAYDLTTDLGLILGVGPPLAGHAAVVLVGSEQWLPRSLSSALRAYVQNGGHVLSLGIDSLLRTVTVRRGTALDPSGPAHTDALGAVPAPVASGNHDLVTVIRDGLGIFQGTSGALAGFSAFQPFAAIARPGRILSEAGTTPAAVSIVGYQLGRGLVVDIGLEGFGSSLSHNLDAQELVNRAWKVLAG